MNTRRKPRLRITFRKPERTIHRLAQFIPTATAMLRHPSGCVGFGTPAGYTRICSCGYQSRDPGRFSQHVTTATIKETIMNDPLIFLDEHKPAFKHRLIDTAGKGKVLICSCGRDFRSLMRMQEHIRYMNEGEHNE